MGRITEKMRTDLNETFWADRLRDENEMLNFEHLYSYSRWTGSGKGLISDSPLTLILCDIYERSNIAR